ncbi:MAG: ABC transporter ATP-binding protein [Deltaproteobacteria bacterium]|nr:ABC transporter ATP-binding protein [Deltaproteobacteria bacterium]
MPALEITGFSYIYPGAQTRALDNISMQVSAGECVCITGPSGSGKTTLLMAIQGLLHGHQEGEVCTDNVGQGLKTAMVFQNAESQILCTTVEDEVAFGPGNIGFTPSEVDCAVTNALDNVGLSKFRGRNVEDLSAGEKHRLTLASVLSMEPAIVLLDEPSSQLDDASKGQLISLLTRLKEKNHTIIITDHDLGIYRTVVDRYIVIRGGTLKGKDPLPFKHINPLELPPDGLGKATRNYSSRETICAERLKLPGPNGVALFQGLSFKAFQGESLYLYGQNGTGKSTLLSCLVGLLHPQAGSIRIAGMVSPRPERLLGKVAMLFQNPSRQLFEDTVFDEVAFSLKRMRLSSSQIKVDVMNALELMEISDLAQRSPLTLSFGEQHRVTLASILAPCPQVLLLDEPFAGLDFEQRRRILHTLKIIRDRHKTTVLIASHTSLPDPTWADSSLVLREGTLAKC